MGPTVTEIVRCLLRDLESTDEAIRYAEQIGQSGAEFAEDYRKAAVILRNMPR